MNRMLLEMGLSCGGSILKFYKGEIYMPFVIIAVIIIGAIISVNAKIVPQAHEYVIEFLGKYKTTWSAGFHVKIPVIEKVAKRVTLKEQVLDSPPQPVITKDNVTSSNDVIHIPISCSSIVFHYCSRPSAHVTTIPCININC